MLVPGCKKLGGFPPLDICTSHLKKHISGGSPLISWICFVSGSLDDADLSDNPFYYGNLQYLISYTGKPLVQDGGWVLRGIST